MAITAIIKKEKKNNSEKNKEKKMETGLHQISGWFQYPSSAISLGILAFAVGFLVLGQGHYNYESTGTSSSSDPPIEQRSVMYFKVATKSRRSPSNSAATLSHGAFERVQCTHFAPDPGCNTQWGVTGTEGRSPRFTCPSKALMAERRQPTHQEC